MKRRLLELSQQQVDSDRQRMDAQSKAIDEAIKALPASATQGAKSVAAGNESAGQLQADIHTQVTQIQAALPATFALADKLFSDKDAAALKTRLSLALADATEQSQKTADSVTPIIGDLQAIGGEARKAATDGLANALTDIETRAKSASQALGELAQGFIRSMLQIINQRLAQQLVDSVAGTGEKGNNGLVGLAVSAIGGAIGGAFGGGSGGDDGNVGASAGGGFATGGYTGDGHPSTPAGIVHKREFVVPANVVDRVGVAALESLGSYPDRVSRVSVGGGGGVAAPQIAELTDSIRELASRPVVPVTHIDQEAFRQITNNTGNIKTLAEVLQRNPDSFKAVIKGLAK